MQFTHEGLDQEQSVLGAEQHVARDIAGQVNPIGSLLLKVEGVDLKGLTPVDLLDEHQWCRDLRVLSFFDRDAPLLASIL